MTRNLGLGIGVLTCLAATSALPSGAHAQGGSTTVDTFTPAARARDGFQLASGDVDADRALHAALVLDYANDPLVYERTSGSPATEASQVVHHQLRLHALFSVGLLDRLQLYAVLPVDAVQRGDSTVPMGVAPADGAGLGDTTLGARVHLLGDDDDRYGLAAQASLTLPTADWSHGAQHYAGEASLTVSPTVAAHVDIGILRIVGNLGLRFRSNQAFLGAQRSDELTYGLGAQVRVVDDSVLLSAELFGTTGFADFPNRQSTPFEGLAGAKWFHDSGLYAGGALGMGFVRGLGSPDVRFLASVGWTTPPCTCDHECEAPALPADTDGDGLVDADDRCPNEAEDADDFEDADGCPDPDNDGDGVLDPTDGAPNDPEDADGFEDADGVPDPDNDRDGVPDAADRCPLEAGVADFQGCPPPDRDGDTVIDPVDNCPDEAGTVENHGCRVQQQVTITEDALEIVDNVYFRTNRDVIEPRSFGLLDNVAAVIVAHPEIAQVRVEGHTDARGNRERNVRLSQARAAAVVAYLVRRGVPESRLAAQGFGPDRPVVPNATTPEDLARNRRVEFHIEDVENRDSGPSADTVDR